MSLRGITVIIVLVVGILAYVAWHRNTEKPAPAQASGESTMPPSGSQAGGMPPSGGMGEGEAVVQTATDHGLDWKVPAGWNDRGPGTMRLATYAIPGHGGADEAQCAVYYFGPGQGGGVDANLERWRSEFKDAKNESRKTFNAPGAKVTRIALTGTYLAHAGMMSMGESVESPNWALLGAIAEGPKGSVFFKLTGPEATVKSAEAAFDGMLKGIRKQ